MQRKTDRKNLQGEETRIRILEETMRLLASHGYAGTNLTMVRKASGVSASSIYWHFADKGHLIAAALEHAYRAQAQTLPNWLDTPPGAVRREDLYAELIRSPKPGSSMDYWRLGLQLAVARPQAEILARDRFLQIRRESTEWLGQWWERTLPEQMEQKAIASILLGQLTVGIRESDFLKLHGTGQLEPHRLNMLIAACLDEVAHRVVELAGEQRLDAVPAPVAKAQITAAGGGREAFLLAAKEVIMEFGYDGVTIARVCEKAELPASSLYWFFKDKDELLATVIANACRGWESIRHLAEPKPADGDWSKIVQAHILPTLGSAANGGGVLALGLLLLLQRADEVYEGRRDMELVVQDAYEMTVLWFRQMFSPAPEDEASADLAMYLTECFFRLIESSLLNRQIEERPWDPALLADLISTAVYRVASKAQDGSAILDPKS